MGFCGIALLLLSVRVIFSRSHSFLTGHACKGVGSSQMKKEAHSRRPDIEQQ